VDTTTVPEDTGGPLDWFNGGVEQPVPLWVSRDALLESTAGSAHVVSAQSQYNAAIVVARGLPAYETAIQMGQALERSAAQAAQMAGYRFDAAKRAANGLCRL
jgi:hypothetical protein